MEISDTPMSKNLSRLTLKAQCNISTSSPPPQCDLKVSRRSDDSVVKGVRSFKSVSWNDVVEIVHSEDYVREEQLSLHDETFFVGMKHDAANKYVHVTNFPSFRPLESRHNKSGKVKFSQDMDEVYLTSKMKREKEPSLTKSKFSAKGLRNRSKGRERKEIQRLVELDKVFASDGVVFEDVQSGLNVPQIMSSLPSALDPLTVNLIVDGLATVVLLRGKPFHEKVLIIKLFLNEARFAALKLKSEEIFDMFMISKFLSDDVSVEEHQAGKSDEKEYNGPKILKDCKLFELFLDLISGLASFTCFGGYIPLEFIIKEIKTVSMCMTEMMSDLKIMEKLLTFIFYVGSRVKLVYETGKLSMLWEGTSVEKWVSEASFLIDCDIHMVDKPREGSITLDERIERLEKASADAKNLPNVARYSAEMVPLSLKVGLCHKMNDLLSKLRSLKAHGDDKPETVGIMLTGPPGTGKTTLFGPLHNIMCGIDGDNNIYGTDLKLNITKEFVDGNHIFPSLVRTIVLDEIDSEDVQKSKVNWAKVIIDIVNTHTFIINRAALEKKDDCALRPKACIMTSNSEKLNVGKLWKEGQAVARRLHLCIKVEVNHEVVPRANVGEKAYVHAPIGREDEWTKFTIVNAVCDAQVNTIIEYIPTGMVFTSRIAFFNWFGTEYAKQRVLQVSDFAKRQASMKAAVCARGIRLDMHLDSDKKCCSSCDMLLDMPSDYFIPDISLVQIQEGEELVISSNIFTIVFRIFVHVFCEIIIWKWGTRSVELQWNGRRSTNKDWLERIAKDAWGSFYFIIVIPLLFLASIFSVFCTYAGWFAYWKQKVLYVYLRCFMSRETADKVFFSLLTVAYKFHEKRRAIMIVGFVVSALALVGVLVSLFRTVEKSEVQMNARIREEDDDDLNALTGIEKGTNTTPATKRIWRGMSVPPLSGQKMPENFDECLRRNTWQLRTNLGDFYGVDMCGVIVTVCHPFRNCFEKSFTLQYRNRLTEEFRTVILTSCCIHRISERDLAFVVIPGLISRHGAKAIRLCLSDCVSETEKLAGIGSMVYPDLNRSVTIRPETVQTEVPGFTGPFAALRTSNVISAKGDCGLPLFSCGRFLGVHCWTNGGVTPIGRDLLEKSLIELPISELSGSEPRFEVHQMDGSPVEFQEELSDNSDFNWMTCESLRVGRFEHTMGLPKMTTRKALGHELVVKYIIDIKGEDYAPTSGRSFEVPGIPYRVSGMTNAVEAMNFPYVFDFECALVAMNIYMLDIPLSARNQPMKLSTAVAMVNGKTSSGFPFTWAGLSPKSKLIMPDGTIHSSVPAMVKSKLAEYSRGVVSDVTFATEKDEAILESKVLKGGTRIFEVSNVATVIAMSMYLTPLLEFLLEHREWSGVAIGINALSDQWKDMWNFISFDRCSTTKYLFTDIKKMDKSISSGMFLIVACMFRQLAGHLGYSGIQQDIVFNMIKGGCLRVIMYRGDAVAAMKGNPSGWWGTTIINCLTRSILLRMVFLASGGCSIASDFRKHVHNMNFGDDEVTGVDVVGALYLSQTKVAKLYEAWGFRVTSADKISELAEYSLFEDASFLKRGVVYTGIYCFAPLEKASIFKMLAWETPGALTREQRFSDVATNACREAYFHGDKFFSQICFLCYQIATLHDIDWVPPEGVDLLRWYQTGTFQTMDA